MRVESIIMSLGSVGFMRGGVLFYERVRGSDNKIKRRCWSVVKKK